MTDSLVRGALAFVVAALFVGCDAVGCALVPCDGEGYGVWVTNRSSDEVLVRFGDIGEETYRVPPNTVDGRGPWISLSDGQRIARVTVWESECVLIATAPLEPGEYRLTIEDDGDVALSSEDVLNDAGQHLEKVGVDCDSV